MAATLKALVSAGLFNLDYYLLYQRERKLYVRNISDYICNWKYFDWLLFY